ncbi:hypothetical protein J2X65_004472 [Ancylobacter sp. 3268]|uniref:hypothetical protein n=1 Tax=Ancylobacter sp. 3268 TaxID=2817752 RepID=UPI002862A805|nr:hypothetical protein [Ancylobacter sp. 3268]MDR6955093.1 hypothetical protein [Ancylobacter sp. 3268]
MIHPKSVAKRDAFARLQRQDAPLERQSHIVPWYPFKDFHLLESQTRRINRALD